MPFERIRRLVGTVERFNDAKRAEERDRVKQGLKLGRTTQPSVLDCCAVLHGIQQGLYAIHQFKSSMLVGQPTGNPFLWNDHRHAIMNRCYRRIRLRC